ncbi:MAG TPA: hypothetical protein VGE01_01940 [Fimbriimonas sp.]
MVPAALALALCQLPIDRDPIEASTLRPGELARLYRYGGRTRTGLFRSLVVVRADGTAVVKTAEAGTALRLAPALRSEVVRALASVDLQDLTKRKPRAEAPSTYDGIDVYLSFRRNGRIVRWSNVTHEGVSDMPVLVTLEKVAALFERS